MPEFSRIAFLAPTGSSGDDEWVRVPSAICGINDTAEASGVFTIKYAWNEKTLRLKLVVFRRQPSTPATLHVFLDTRNIASARMDEYERGVAHFFFPLPTTTEAKIGGSTVPAEVFGQTKGVTTAILSTEWRNKREQIEISVPWQDFPDFRPTEGRWLGLTIRLEIGSGQHRRTIQTCSTPEEANPIESTPISFGRMVLAGALKVEPTAFAAVAEEVIVAQRPYLHVRLVEPAEDVSGKPSPARLECAALHVATQLPFVPSVSGQFWCAEDWVRIGPLEDDTPTVNLRITTDDNGKANAIERETVIRTAFLRRSIDQVVRTTTARGVTYQQKVLIELLRDAAFDVAANEAISEDGVRVAGKRFRSVIDHDLYPESIAILTRTIQRIGAGRVDPRTFPFTAFKSRIDGSWIPVKIVPPWNCSPNRTYSATVHFYGRMKNRTRAEFLSSDLLAIERGQYPGAFGTGYSIAFFDRTENGVGFEDECLDYLTVTLVPTLNLRPEQLTIAGVSAGASTALWIATRHPDRFSAVHARGGDFGNAINEDGVSQLQNLRGTVVYLTAGSRDVGVAESNRQLTSILKDLAVPCIYEELPNTRHNFTPLPAPQEITSARKVKTPRTIDLVTHSPDQGTAYWLDLTKLESWGQLASVHGQIEDDTVKLTTVNTAECQIRIGDIRASIHIARVEIDGQPLAVEDSVSVFRATKDDHANWHQSEPSALAQIAKRPGQSGPADRILRGPLCIVYGTSQPECTPLLRARAFNIARILVGIGEEQYYHCAVEIVSDRDVNLAGVSEANLWIIGGRDENLIMAEVTKEWSNTVTKVCTESAGSENRVVGMIHPRAGLSNRYVFVEQGSSAPAYRFFVPWGLNHDGAITDVIDGELSVTTFDFDSNWKFAP
jgi:hypothetical protein